MTLRGSVASFPLETIVQLIAATAKTGQLEIRGGGESGTLGFSEGRLVSAMSGDDTGDPALGAVFALSDGEFEFLPWSDAPATNLTGDLNQLLDRAVVQRDRIVADRELISDDRMRFALSEGAAAAGEVRLSADQWRTLLAVNGERDLHAIAGHLKLGRLGSLAVLADLVRSGIVEVIAPPPPEPPATPDDGPGGGGSGEPAARSTWDAPAAPIERPTWAAEQAEPEAAARSAWETPAEPAADTRTWDAPADWEQPARDGGAAPEADPWRDAPPPADVAEEDEPVASAAAAYEPAPPAQQGDNDIDARLAALSGAFSDETAPAEWPAPKVEPATEGPDPRPLYPVFPPPLEAADAPAAPAAEEPKKRGGLFSGLFRKDETHARPETAGAATQSGTRASQLAGIANGLLDEFTGGEYGKGRIDDRMANLLMRVDEQADPIDHPLPVANDRIDVAALGRSGASEAQVAPYLALLISQIYEDAERAFGKDKARRAYKSVQHGVIGDASLGTDLRLPRV